MTEYIKPITETPKFSHYPDEVTVVREPVIIARKYTNSKKTTYIEIPIPISFINSMEVTYYNNGSIRYEIIYNFNKYKKDAKDKAVNISNNDFESIVTDEATYDKIHAIWRELLDNDNDNDNGTVNDNCPC